jgi:hypothetical protein
MRSPPPRPPHSLQLLQPLPPRPPPPLLPPRHRGERWGEGAGAGGRGLDVECHVLENRDALDRRHAALDRRRARRRCQLPRRAAPLSEQRLEEALDAGLGTVDPRACAPRRARTRRRRRRGGVWVWRGGAGAGRTERVPEVELGLAGVEQLPRALRAGGAAVGGQAGGRAGGSPGEPGARRTWIIGDRAGSGTPPAVSSCSIASRIPWSCSALAFCPRLLVAATSSSRRASAAGCSGSVKLMAKAGKRASFRPLRSTSTLWHRDCTEKGHRKTPAGLASAVPDVEKACVLCTAAATSKAATSAAQRCGRA